MACMARGTSSPTLIEQFGELMPWLDVEQIPRSLLLGRSLKSHDMEV